MKPLCPLLLSVFLSAAAAFSQPFSFGVKGGMPLTDFVSAVSAQNINASTTTNRYILGVTGEARLPFGLGVEVDVLYRHFRYNSSGIANSLYGNVANIDTSSG